MIKAILLMAGRGERLGSTLPKQFHVVAGKKVYLHTLDRFLSCKLFGEIILVCPAEWGHAVKQDLLPYGAEKIQVVEGGGTRQESSYLGLLACGGETTHVVIHDAVRPFVTQEILKKNVEAAHQFGAVDTCIPSADTLVHSKGGQQIDAIPVRAAYLRGQTPQSFSLPLILGAHQKAKGQKISCASDDCSLVLALGKPVHIVLGDEHNIKITTELDLFIAEQLFRLPSTYTPSPYMPSTHMQREDKRNLAGKVFVVTGGNGGIGKPLCALLREEGAEVVVLSRSSEKFRADLTSFEETRAAFAQIGKEYGPVDGLINCVGHLKRSRVEALSALEIEQLIATNFTAVVYACKCAALKEGAHILNIASSAYSRGRGGQAVYAAAKAAVVNFSQGLAEENPHLRVYAIAPQRTDTPLRRLHFPFEPQETLLSAKEVAESLVSLLKEEGPGCSIIELRNR